jgi:protein SCO1/2
MRVFALLALGAALTACASAGTSPAPRLVTAQQVGDELHGAVLRPANVEPRIVLTDTAGHRYDILARDRGKVTLLYFGYTHCPDVCPTTMADLAEALRQSPPAVRRRVVVVFVTVDPRRDRLPVLRRWLGNFDPAFVGLRGTLRQVVADQQAAGLPASRVEPNGKTVEHAAIIVAYTPDRREHVFYGEGPSTIDDLRHDLPILVSAAPYA